MNKSILVIARNEEDWPLKTIEDFKKHMPDAEIICIDDGGENQWGKDVKVIKTEGAKGVGYCRSLALKYAKPGLIMTSDAHVAYDHGNINKAWQLASEGYVVNPTVTNMVSNAGGCGRKWDPLTGKANYVRAKQGQECSLIGSVYFMKKEVAEQIIAPTPGHGSNEQIMTCGALVMKHHIYAMPDLSFKHHFKKKFNYQLSYKDQQKNRDILNAVFFGKPLPVDLSKEMIEYNQMIQQLRLLTPEQLIKKIQEINEILGK